MRFKDPNDVDSVRRFRHWIFDQCALRGFAPNKSRDCEELAAKFNARKRPDEPSRNANAFRMWVQRQEELTSVHKDSCRLWTLALDIPLNTVRWEAGYRSDDAYSELSELPIALQPQYGALNEVEKTKVHALIAQLSHQSS